jgi:uncharacterized protein YifN (PemK superfamily)
MMAEPDRSVAGDLPTLSDAASASRAGKIIRGKPAKCSDHLTAWAKADDAQRVTRQRMGRLCPSYKPCGRLFC